MLLTGVMIVTVFIGHAFTTLKKKRLQVPLLLSRRGCVTWMCYRYVNTINNLRAKPRTKDTVEKLMYQKF